MSEIRDAASDMTGTSAELGDWGEEYLRALDIAAAHAGIPPLDLHRQITDGIASTQASPDCLTLLELEACLADTLPPARRAHASSCSFCVELLQVVGAVHPEHQAAFAADGVASAAAPSSTLVAGIGLAMTSLGLAGLAYHYLHGRSSKPDTSERKDNE